MKGTTHYCECGTSCCLACILLWHLYVWHSNLTVVWWLGMLFHCSLLDSHNSPPKLPGLWGPLTCNNIVTFPQFFVGGFSISLVLGVMCPLWVTFWSFPISGLLPFMRRMLWLLFWFVLIFMQCCCNIYWHIAIHCLFLVIPLQCDYTI